MIGKLIIIILAVVLIMIIVSSVIKVVYYNNEFLKFHNDEIDVSNVSFKYRNIFESGNEK